MNTRTANRHFTIVSLIFLNLPILLAVITINDQDSFSQSLEVQNETEHSIPDRVQDSDLEPSLELNLEVTNLESGLEELTDNTTENSDIVTRTLLNDTPVLLPTDSSTVDVEQVAEVSLVLTSQHEEIPTPNIATVTENIPKNISSNISDIIVENLTESTSLDTEAEEKNITEGKSEDIPSFSEWAQKRLEEVEKNKQTNESVKGQVVNGKGLNAKLRWKNYASLDCGAKVVGANSESVSPGSILSPAVDEYKLSPCTSRIWFVVELCEAIQAQRIDLANYELFSSSPKDFTVSVSERFPTKDWVVLGKFTAKDEKDIQSFDIETQLFGKYIKVEIKSHYGTEHYCPISLFRAYGMSVFEVLQKEDPGNDNPPDEDDDDDDDDEETLNIDHNPGKAQKNVFTSATDAVISMVKRAAEALGNKVDNETVFVEKSNASTLVNTCSSPRHVVVCNNCSGSLFGQIFELLSCKAEEIRKLVNIPAITSALVDSDICRRFGYEFKTPYKETTKLEHFEAFFPEKYLGAMCNEAAILEKQGLLNVSQQFLNATKNLTKEKIINMNVKDSEEQEQKTNDTFVENTEVVGNTAETPSCTTADDISQIKPTKTFSLDPNLTQTVVEIEEPILESISESPETATTTPQEVTIENPLSAEVDSVTEAPEVLEEHIDHIADMNVDNPSTAVPSSSSSNSPQAPKESIFLRLSNRIKALERNMSLSGQYLEELSKRYKRQVEEMQLLMEKTIAMMREETQERSDQNKQLEERLNHLTTSIEELMAERRLFFSVVYFLLLFVVVWFGFRLFCGARSKARRKSEDVDEILRHVTEESAKVRKKRRPSDQVLKIVRYSSVNEEERHRRAKKRKKKAAAKRSNSAGSLKLKDEDWPQNTHQVIEDVPFLDENDMLTLEACTFPNDFAKSDSPGRIDTEENSSLQSNECSINYLNNIPSEPIKKEKKGFKKFLKKVF